MKNILVVGEDDSTLSQMMRGWMTYYVGKAGNVYSAGLEKGKLNMFSSSAMMDAVIDITRYECNELNDYKEQEFDYIVFVNENLEDKVDIQAKEDTVTKLYEDPKDLDITEEKKVEKYKKIRDEMEEFIFDFVNSNIKQLLPPGI